MKMQKLVALAAVFAVVLLAKAAVEEATQKTETAKFKSHHTVGLSRKAKHEQEQQQVALQEQNVERWGHPGCIGFETEQEIRHKVTTQEGQYGHPYSVNRGITY